MQCFRLFMVIVLCTLGGTVSHAQEHSVAREWNEVLLEAIRDDLARPTVHARNLFHTSVAMYDAWSIIDGQSRPYLLDSDAFACPVDSFPIADSADIVALQEEALSYAVYKVLVHRFSTSVGDSVSVPRFHDLMIELGYDTSFTDLDYTGGSAAALGNYVGECVIAYGLSDGSNEVNDYANQYYEPVNPPILPDIRGNRDIEDPNRWQTVQLDVFIDQSGVRIDDTLEFLSPEWGNVKPFALDTNDITTYSRDGDEYKVYVDPDDPPYIALTDSLGSAQYRQGFTMVSVWSSHLDPLDTTEWDISPGALGNHPQLPEDPIDYLDYYDFYDGGDGSTGYEINPVTGQTYTPNVVKRGDFARVLAEFWADGPDSETPPGHWFTLLNEVNEDPDLVKRFKGVGPILSDLEWDVKSYLALGGAMHDCAIAAWSAKGWYDYLRPISAIRFMGDEGQSSFPDSTRYSHFGLPLIPGLVELILPGDPLAGSVNQHIGKLKLFTWRGPDFIGDPLTNNAGVGWIRAENWWPYQRPTFVTPPFAGYVSGHSTFSRGAAELLAAFTGSPYFPGGLHEFVAPANNYLVFENGPSEDVVLQWASYVDASNQSSLSRIWGGIHPPADDIPGRKMGIYAGNKAFDFAERLFQVDNDNDGYFSYEDCDDTNPDVNPGQGELCDGLDQNCNGEIDEGLVISSYFMDEDGDGFGRDDMSIDTCLTAAPMGFAALSGDCNDQDSTIYPGAPELCDGLDQNCNGEVDEGLTLEQYFLDEDGDGFGVEDGVIDTCLMAAPLGFAAVSGDCNDQDSTIYPGAPEICDGLDQDCDGDIDEGFETRTLYVDEDDDGFGVDELAIDSCTSEVPAGFVLQGGDCNDRDSTVFPGAPEICDDLDNNCDGEIDEGLDITRYYRDADMDGYGTDNFTLTNCLPEPPEGFVAQGGDCDDRDPDINPGADEIPNNGIDEDCDGMDSIVSTRRIDLVVSNIYPIPASDHLIAEIDNAYRQLSYQWRDMQGRAVSSGVLDNNLGQIRIDLPDSPSTQLILELTDIASGAQYIQIITIAE